MYKELSKTPLPGLVSVPVAGTSVTTTRNLCSMVGAGEKIIIKGEELERHATDPCTANTLPLSAAFTGAHTDGSDAVGVGAFANGNGNAWTLLFPVYDGSLDSFRVTPESDWAGSGVQLRLLRAHGVAPNSMLIGSLSEVQTVSLRAALAHGGYGYTLQFNGVSTNCLSWDANAQDIATELELIDGIDRVSIDTTGDGSSSSSFGYVHTLTFWGVSTLSTVPELVPFVGSAVGCSDGDGSANPEILVHTAVESSAHAPTVDVYASLAENTTYSIRVSAANERGYGAYTETYATTADVAVVPGPVTAFHVGRYYDHETMSVHFDAPFSDGGAPLTKVQIEWDTSASFDSLNKQIHALEVVSEVQTITTAALSDSLGGTFTLTWGGIETTPLGHAATIEEMASALRIITGAYSHGENPIVVSREAVGNGHQWAVTFTGVRGDIGLLRADYTLLEGYGATVSVVETVKGNADIIPGTFTHEVQTISTRALSDITGSFKLRFEGYETGSIDYSATAQEMKSALEQLSTIHTVNVHKDTLASRNQAVWTVEFTHLVDELVQGAGNIGLMHADASSLNGVMAQVVVAEKIKGSAPFYYDIQGLNNGTSYYVRAAAFNHRGHGAYSTVKSFAPKGRPGTPPTPHLTVNTSTSLNLDFSLPASDNGAPLDHVLLEWFVGSSTTASQTITTSATAGINEVQTLTTTADGTIGGSFYLKFGGELSEVISADETASGLEDILERMSTIGNVVISEEASQVPVPGTVTIANGSPSVASCDGSTACFAGLSRGISFGWQEKRSVCPLRGTLPIITMSILQILQIAPRQRRSREQCPMLA